MLFRSIAFMFVTIGIYRLRPREGKDLPVPGFKMPLYPVLPALAFLGALFVFLGLDHMAKLVAGIWFVLGLLIYIIYGIRKKCVRNFHAFFVSKGYQGKIKVVFSKFCNHFLRSTRFLKASSVFFSR